MPESAYIRTGDRLARRRRAVSHTGVAGRASRYNDRDRAFGTPCETQGHCPAARLHLLAARRAGRNQYWATFSGAATSWKDANTSRSARVSGST